jgi:hypothetical protein
MLKLEVPPAKGRPAGSGPSQLNLVMSAVSLRRVARTDGTTDKGRRAARHAARAAGAIRVRAAGRRVRLRVEHREIANALATISAKMFSGLWFIQYLYMQHNKITAIADHAFKDLGSLNKLKLDNNGITTVAANTFSGLDGLNELNLNYNLISHISDDAFTNEGNLERLYLSYNKLTSISSSVFFSASNLFNIHLDSNLIATIADGAFPSSLEYLRLNGNRLTAISRFAFSGLW